MKKTALGMLGSGNVFADLGLPDPETHLLKATILSKISEVIEKRRLGQATAARLMRLSQPDLNKLLSGHTSPYAIDDLKKRLQRLST